MPIKTIVWTEEVYTKKNRVARDIYPNGLGQAIADGLKSAAGIEPTLATLAESEHGLTDARLANADVLFWWGHLAHKDVQDHVVDRVIEHVWSGLGLVLLHSAQGPKLFRRVLGTSGRVTWRNSGERERIFLTDPQHPLAKGLPGHFQLEVEEMYGEPFGVPDPLENPFIAWFEGGEAFRAGLTFKRGSGKVFYFQPGHETFPTFHDENIKTILRNAARWAHNPYRAGPNVNEPLNRSMADALEPIGSGAKDVAAPVTPSPIGA